MLSALPLLSALLLTPTADAAFGGKIKNIRVRERNNSQGYRVIVVVKDDMDGAALDPRNDSDGDGVADHVDWQDGRLGVVFTPVDGGPALQPVSTASWTRQRTTFTSDTLAGLGAADVVVTVGGRTIPLSLQGDGGWDEASDDLYTVSGRIVDNGDATGQIEVRLQGLARDADLSGVGTLTVSTVPDPTASKHTGTTTVRLAATSGLARAVLDVVPVDTTADPAGHTYALDGSLERDHDGSILDSLAQMVVMSGDAGASGLHVSKTRIKRNGDLKHTAITVSDDPSVDFGMDVLISDAETATPILASMGDTPVAVERQFEYADLAFDGVPSGETFAMTLTLRDETGAAVGAPVSTTLSLDHSGGAGFSSAAFGWSGASHGLVVFEQGDSAREAHAFVALTGDGTGEVASVELEFDGPFEGLSPQENPLTLGFIQEWQKWVVTAPLEDGLGGGGIDVEVMLHDADDGLLEELRYDGGIGGRQRANGKGTRNAAANTANSAELL